jgi:hypothetical protein
MCKCVITVEEKVAVKYQPKPKALTSDHITGVNRPLKKKLGSIRSPVIVQSFVINKIYLEERIMVPSQSSESVLTPPFKALCECSVPACIAKEIENTWGHVHSKIICYES